MVPFLPLPFHSLRCATLKSLLYWPNAIYNYGYFCGGNSRESQRYSVEAHRTNSPFSPTGFSALDLLLLPNLVQTVTNGAVNTYPASTGSLIAGAPATRLAQSATALLRVYVEHFDLFELHYSSTAATARACYLLGFWHCDWDDNSQQWKLLKKTSLLSSLNQSRDHLREGREFQRHWGGKGK